MSTEDKPSSPPVTIANRSKQALVVCALATLAMTGLDLWSKAWALDALSAEPFVEPPGVCALNDEGFLMGMQRRATEPVVLVEGYLEFRYAENCGAAFGIMRDLNPWVRKGVFGAAAIIATLALAFMFYRGRGGKYFAAAVPCIISGALGNFWDRFTLGYVVDFIRFHWNEAWSYPTFNIADVTISAGVILLLIDQFLDWKRERAEAAASGDERAPEATPAEG